MQRNCNENSQISEDDNVGESQGHSFAGFDDIGCGIIVESRSATSGSTSSDLVGISGRFSVVSRIDGDAMVQQGGSNSTLMY